MEEEKDSCLSLVNLCIMKYKQPCPIFEFSLSGSFSYYMNCYTLCDSITNTASITNMVSKGIENRIKYMFKRFDLDFCKTIILYRSLY